MKKIQRIHFSLDYLIVLNFIGLMCSWGNMQMPPAVEASMGAVVNGDFAQIRPEGEGFVGWDFLISRQAAVRLAIDRTGGRNNSSAPLFHNESPLSPHVYGRFRQTVKVLPNMGYRLSCWCKAQNAAAGNHWTDWKTYMLWLPSGSYDWQRVETYFTTKPEQTELDLGLNIVDVTEQLWIDDVTLIPDLAAAQKDALWLGFYCAPAVNVEQEELLYRIWTFNAPAEATLKLEVRAGAALIGEASVPETRLPTAQKKNNESLTEYAGHLKLAAAAARSGIVRVLLQDAAGKRILTAERPVELLSAAYARARWLAAQTQMQALRQALRQWERKGLPTDYPRVTATVAENFLPWIEQDIQRGDVRLAIQELEELHEALAAALQQCDEPPPITALAVPRYTGGPIRLKNGHFEAEVRWPDGKREQRPVFFLGYGHFGSVKRDLEKFPAYGLNIIQVEFGPNSVVRPDMSCDMRVVEEFIGLLERAAKAGVAVNLLLSPHYFPQWAYEKWPEIGGVEGGFIRFDIDAPQVRAIQQAFFRAVIPRLRGYPALHSLCLSNEPIYVSAPNSAYNRQKWQAWLAKHYNGDIARLNALYGTNYASFADVPIHSRDNLEPSPQLYDWITFNNERFAAWHRWMAEQIHTLAPEIPVHAKIMNGAFSPRSALLWGVDVEQFCDLSQIAGNDCCNWYNRRPDSRLGNGSLGEMMFYDLLRSMRGQPVFNSENHVVPDRDWDPVPGMHMRNLLWQGALHGMGASTMWVWERTTDPNSDFAGSVMHRPLLCDAHGRTALDLMRLAPEIVALQQAPARVALVYSLASLVWNTRYPALVAAAYEALTQLGEKVDFLTWRQLARGEAMRYQALILPGVSHLEEEGFAGIKSFAAASGKQLIGLGEGVLCADEYNRPRSISGLPLVSLPEADSYTLAQRLRQALRLEWPVRVAVSPVKPPAGVAAQPPVVGFRWARVGRRYLVNVCNYGAQPVIVRVSCQGASRVTNLFNGQPVRNALRLLPLEPLLLEAR